MERPNRDRGKVYWLPQNALLAILSFVGINKS